jgi:hypothetical protein
MNTLLNAIAATLLARARIRAIVPAARSRAEAVMRKQAAMKAPHQEVYSANAGGWN